MLKRPLQKLQQLFLMKLNEISGSKVYELFDIRQIKEELELTDQEETNIMASFAKSDLIKFTFGKKAMITPQGVIKAEEYMAQDYADEELLVLKTIYELAKNLPNQEVHYREVEKAIDLPHRELITIQMELYDNKKYLMPSSDETLKVSPRGMEFLEGKSNMPKNTGDTFNVNNYGNSINQMGGRDNTLNAQMNLNPEFDNAIKSIVDLIQSSSLSAFKKEDLITNIEHVKGLPTDEPSKELGEHGKSKINYLELAVKGTDIAIKLTPHFQTLYTYFENLIRASS